MDKLIAPAAFVAPVLAFVVQTFALSITLALPLPGWMDPAIAQEAVHISHEARVLSDCQDLMNKIRQQYGRAPLCLTVINPGGPSLTDLNGLVGLADDMTNPWYEMRFATDVSDPTLYRYEQSDLNNVVTLIQYSHHGLTKEQMGQVLTSNACGQVESRLRAMRDAGTFTEQQYQYALSDLLKTTKGCAK